MSSAARDPLPADELPALLAAQAMITEAPPDPPPGPERETLAAGGAQRIEAAVTMMESAIHTYIERVTNVVEARLRGPKARKNTRWWSPSQVKSVSGREVAGFSTHISGIEVKALDASYVLPDRLADELADAVRPVGLRIVADTAGSVAKSLGRPNTGLAAFDWSVINTAVESAVAHMLEVNDRHARDVRAAILAADSSAETLDEAIDRVLEATRRGGTWLLLHGRALATALAGDAALGAAKALGVTHTQWLSRRDGSVRHTHVKADGQVRAIGTPFTVGAFRLQFPADPSDLPASWSEVANCRCSLLFTEPPLQRRQAVGLVKRGTRGAARRLLGDAMVTGGPVVLGAPELRAGMSIPQVPVPANVVGYRVLDTEPVLEPGQQVTWPGSLALALAPPVAARAVVLAVALPVGMAVGAASGAVVLPAGAALSVVSVAAGQIVATPAAA